MNNIEGTIFEDYSSVVFDLDRTIWECFTSEGTSIGAYAMTAPFELKSGLLIKDINGNYCKLQEGVRTIIKSLDADDINLGVVSSGENTVNVYRTTLLEIVDLLKAKREYGREWSRQSFHWWRERFSAGGSVESSGNHCKASISVWTTRWISSSFSQSCSTFRTE